MGLLGESLFSTAFGGLEVVTANVDVEEVTSVSSERMPALLTRPDHIPEDHVLDVQRSVVGHIEFGQSPGFSIIPPLVEEPIFST
jgi:hypothetical protein